MAGFFFILLSMKHLLILLLFAVSCTNVLDAPSIEHSYIDEWTVENYPGQKVQFLDSTIIQNNRAIVTGENITYTKKGNKLSIRYTNVFGKDSSYMTIKSVSAKILKISYDNRYYVKEYTLLRD